MNCTLSQKLGLTASISTMNLSKYYTKDEIDKLFAEVLTLKKDSYFDFPNIGESLTLYVDVGAGSTYIWDEDTNTYVCIGKDYEKIQTINGGNANE